MRLQLALALATSLVILTGGAEAAALKAVVFAVEGVDLATTPQTEQRLQAATDLLRAQIAARGLSVVDTAPQAAKIKDNLPLHECNGCDEDIAKALGGDIEIATAVRQAASAVYALSGSVKDVRTGRVLRQGTVNVQGDGADEWAHAVKFLTKERLLDPPLPDDAKLLAADKVK